MLKNSARRASASKLASVCFVFLLVCLFYSNHGLCAVENELGDLNAQRQKLLNEVKAALISGKMDITDAQKLKVELDGIISAETNLKRDPSYTPDRLREINNKLIQSAAHINSAIHPDKVWLGIDSKDKTLDQKISNALAAQVISKQQAEGFKKRLETIRGRSANSYPNRGITFTEAMSLAKDIQTLNNDIDRAVRHTI